MALSFMLLWRLMGSWYYWMLATKASPYFYLAVKTYNLIMSLQKNHKGFSQNSYKDNTNWTIFNTSECNMFSTNFSTISTYMLLSVSACNHMIILLGKKSPSTAIKNHPIESLVFIPHKKLMNDMSAMPL